MTNDVLKKQVLIRICALKEAGHRVVIVHGGGPFIERALEEANIESEFVDGHRKTTKEALKYVEMALKGQVNGSLVNIINQLGHQAVGLSGKDGRLATAHKRLHQTQAKGSTQTHDLGFVGDIASIDPKLIHLLLDNGFVPVVTCLASDAAGNDYNINADMFAGHLAGALQADAYVVLTDVDGLRKDKDDASTLISTIGVAAIDDLMTQGVIQGGMVPKMEACRLALEKGARSARIINGTKPEQIDQLYNGEAIGTLLTL